MKIVEGAGDVPGMDAHQVPKTAPVAIIDAPQGLYRPAQPMAPIVHPSPPLNQSPDGERAEDMQQDDQHRAKLSTEDTLQESIASLLRSLTVVLACTQLLQRQSQPHGDVAPELINQRVAMIEAAATDMVDRLRQLEDLYSPERD